MSYFYVIYSPNLYLFWIILLKSALCFIFSKSIFLTSQNLIISLCFIIIIVHYLTHLCSPACDLYMLSIITFLFTVLMQSVYKNVLGILADLMTDWICISIWDVMHKPTKYEGNIFIFLSLLLDCWFNHGWIVFLIIKGNKGITKWLCISWKYKGI